MIRPSQPEDKAAIFALAKVLAITYKVEDAGFQRAWAALSSSTSACLLVAEEEKKVVGYILGFVHPVFYANGLVAWIEEVVVEESARKKGLGRELMTHFEAWAKTMGCPQVALASRRAEEFYKAIGYTDSSIYFKKKI